jgi:subtilisin-like proprotein convertase family protein
MTHRNLGRQGRLTLLFATALVALGITAAGASAATVTFSNPTPIQIPDSGTATPYPSTVGVTGFGGGVQKATVTLRDLTHTCPQDITALLVGPSGAKSILMNNVGGCPQAEIGLITLTFDQSAPNPVPGSDVPASGTYQPTTDGTPPTLSPPAPPGPYDTNLGDFNGALANGTWQLFIEDCCGADQGSVTGGWSLNLTGPVNTVKAGKPKLNKKKGTARLPVTVGDAGKVTLKGKGVKSASKGSGGPGTVKLTVKPKGKTASKLNSTGKATAKVKVAFTPTGGTGSVVTKKVKLKLG